MASDDYEVNSPESEQELPASAASAGAAIYDIPSEDAEKIERRAQAKKAERRARDPFKRQCVQFTMRLLSGWCSFVHYRYHSFVE